MVSTASSGCKEGPPVPSSSATGAQAELAPLSTHPPAPAGGHDPSVLLAQPSSAGSAVAAQMAFFGRVINPRVTSAAQEGFQDT